MCVTKCLEKVQKCIYGFDISLAVPSIQTWWTIQTPAGQLASAAVKVFENLIDYR